jgi:hypothetical protein
MAYRRHYSTNHFTNQGERWIDQDLYTQLNAHPDYWVGLHSLLLNQSESSTRGECDFVLFHRLGIIVVEVKASEIKFENGSFWQKEKGEFKERANFFTQAEKNAQKIIDLLHKRGVYDVLVTSACVFPESIIEHRPDYTRPFWSLASKNAGTGLSDFIEEELIERRGFFKNGVNLDRTRINSLVSLLSPDLLSNDILQHLTISAQQAKIRGEQNLAMLDGLNANPRIMIAGPAGSGKSSFGKLQLGRKFKEGKRKLLYICWNEFLAEQIKLDLKAEKINADVYPLYQLWVHLAEKMNTTGPINYNWSSDTSLRNEEIKELITALFASSDTHYEFIVADEAQDLFNRGLMDLVPALLHKKSTLEAGEFTILYDNSQAFGSTSTKDDYQLNLEAFRESSAIYQLSERFRGHDGTGIFEFIRELDRGTPDFSKQFGEDVKIEKWNTEDPKDLARKIIALKNRYHTIVKLPLNEILLLFTSSLISGDLDKPKVFDPLIQNDFTPLSKDNIGNTDKTVKYATCLKCKGLEKSVVILVVEKSENLPLIYHQIFIGSTRAKSKIHVFLPE